MKCCLCGKEITEYGNNPYPLVAFDDNSSRCCDDCNNQYVIPARLLQMKGNKEDIDVGDTIIILFAGENNEPIESFMDYCQDIGKIARGEITEIIDNKFKGTWGNYLIDRDNDNYVLNP